MIDDNKCQNHSKCCAFCEASAENERDAEQKELEGLRYQQKTTQGAIIETIRDLDKFHHDAMFVGNGETIFDRLCSLYCMAGGDESELEKEWPEYF